MTYKWAVMRGGLLLDRTLTHGRALKIAARYIGAVVVALIICGCTSKHIASIPCDADNCGKLPGGK